MEENLKQSESNTKKHRSSIDFKRLKKFNDIDSDPLYPPPRNPERFYCDNYENFILYVGRLEPIKRISLLIETFRYIKTKVKCYIVGTGSQETELARKISEYNLYNKIQLLGFQHDDEIYKLYANALAVFYAPLDEDYGFVTLEAFLSKKPIITTIDSGGVLEFVKNNENGFILNLDPKNIAEKIDWMYSNNAKCYELGSTGYEFARKITWDNIIEKLIY